MIQRARQNNGYAFIIKFNRGKYEFYTYTKNNFI